MSHTVDGWLEMTYKYNADGVRTHKTAYDLDVDDYTEHEYILNGTQIVAEIIDNYTTLIYLYDENGAPIGMKYRTAAYAAGVFDTFFFEKNLQGDVIAVYDSNGTKLISYTYDAWGNFRTTYVTTGTTALGKAIRNPFKYRGYYYDNDTGWYYLQTRYYNPIWGRFINADGEFSEVGGDILGYNLFAYCFNNPINMGDPIGAWPQWIKNAVKWVASDVIMPLVDSAQKALSKIDLTYSTGINVSGTPSFWIFNGQVGLSLDTKGNIAIQASIGGGVTVGDPGVSVTRYKSITNAPNINKLNGEYIQAGGSIAALIGGVPLTAGGDVMCMPDSESNDVYWGVTGNAGVGSPGKDFHIEWGQTTTWNITQFNIFDVINNVYDRIMGW